MSLLAHALVLALMCGVTCGIACLLWQAPRRTRAAVALSVLAVGLVGYVLVAGRIALIP